jgi:antitoxin ParD1/3/4
LGMEHTMPKLTSLHVSLPEDLKEFVRQEVAEGGYSTPSDFVRTVLRDRRAKKVRERVDEALLASLETPAEEVTPEYLVSLRQEAKALINRKEASGRKSHKEV